MLSTNKVAGNLLYEFGKLAGDSSTLEMVSEMRTKLSVSHSICRGSFAWAMVSSLTSLPVP